MKPSVEVAVSLFHSFPYQAFTTRPCFQLQQALSSLIAKSSCYTGESPMIKVRRSSLLRVLSLIRVLFLY